MTPLALIDILCIEGAYVKVDIQVSSKKIKISVGIHKRFRMRLMRIYSGIAEDANRPSLIPVLSLSFRREKTLFTPLSLTVTESLSAG